ncbi:hypothetical protein PRUPE_3G230700 [Prunus persica]|uniref:LysM domain-containing protein n=2 Tax=Prunus TaxID=3754 RepID=A0A251Q4C2_PRUPE|nr:hypothetical protein PRUPE_3G230700 [Prunus persica]
MFQAPYHKLGFFLWAFLYKYIEKSTTQRNTEFLLHYIYSEKQVQMAKNSSRVAIMNLILLLSLLLMVSMAESRQLGIGFGKEETSNPSNINCDSVYGAEEGDTCGSVIEKFNLSSDFFLSINPNINCDSFFVGQWLCTQGTVN